MGKHGAADWPGANHLATLHGGADDRASDANAGVKGAGNWHRIWLSDGDPGASGASRVLG